MHIRRTLQKIYAVQVVLHEWEKHFIQKRLIRDLIGYDYSRQFERDFQHFHLERKSISINQSTKVNGSAQE